MSNEMIEALEGIASFAWSSMRPDCDEAREEAIKRIDACRKALSHAEAAISSAPPSVTEEEIARAFYLGMYGPLGGRWEANDTKDIWLCGARGVLAMLSAAPRLQDAVAVLLAELKWLDDQAEIRFEDARQYNIEGDKTRERNASKWQAEFTKRANALNTDFFFKHGKWAHGEWSFKRQSTSPPPPLPQQKPSHDHGREDLASPPWPANDSAVRS